MRCPAKTTALRNYNVKLAIEAFKRRNCPLHLCASPSDVVGGVREKTLALLWRLMLTWKVMPLIDAESLESEIFRIQKLASRRASSIGRAAARMGRTSEGGIVDTQLYMNMNTNGEKLRVLLEWCRTVCARFGVRVHNFTSSFSDGVVVSDLPCDVRREGGHSLVIGGSSLVILEGKACNPL